MSSWCKECQKERAKKYQKENWDKAKKAQSDWRSRNQEYARKRFKNWRDENIEHINDYQSKYYENNKEKFKTYGVNRRNKNHNITKQEWKDCKEYFNNECAYCGLTYEQHKKLYKEDLHKEHVVYDGLDDLSNCVPACKNCNSQKWEFELDYWYNKENPVFTEERYTKIIKWTEEDYSKYIKPQNPKRKYNKT